jgi:two-component system chemotaxis response regulator CheY
MDPKRILVVDDGITMRLFYRDVLEKEGFAVDEAVNGLEGLERAMLGCFELILIDVNMPRMDGFTLVDRLRHEPPLAAVPVLMISTEATAQDEVRALELGVNLYMVKPPQPVALAAAARLMTGVPL